VVGLVVGVHLSLVDASYLETIMPFPASPRVIYQHNPLAEVICQLQFPAILRIDSELPAAYQEKLRGQYPYFDTASQDLVVDIPQDITQLLTASGQPPFRFKPSYNFLSADRSWKVKLTRESLTLYTQSYQRWEQFKEQLGEPLQSLIDIYSPSFFTRIGLRYKDVVQRASLNLKDVSWSDLLKPHIAAALSSEDIAADVTQTANQFTMKLEEGSGQVLVNYGLSASQTEDPFFLIDCDFFTTQRIEVNDAVRRLDYFNEQAGNCFRWCITPRLHQAMEPKAVE
jgi:uncharacterized protein (TIGR04255 family)